MRMRWAIWPELLCLGLLTFGAPALAQERGPSNPTIGAVPSARVEWGIWVSPDGCEYWIADGVDEGYLVDRVHPETGLPVCHAVETCLTTPGDAMFASGGATLSAAATERLRAFFRDEGAYSYAIHGHTDSRGDAAANLALSQRRADAVAAVARSVGAVVERQVGHGETQPVASNATSEGMAQNRRVDVVCYRN